MFKDEGIFSSSTASSFSVAYLLFMPALIRLPVVNYRERDPDELAGATSSGTIAMP